MDDKANNQIMGMPFDPVSDARWAWRLIALAGDAVTSLTMIPQGTAQHAGACKHWSPCDTSLTRVLHESVGLAVMVVLVAECRCHHLECTADGHCAL